MRPAQSTAQMLPLLRNHATPEDTRLLGRIDDLDYEIGRMDSALMRPHKCSAMLVAIRYALQYVVAVRVRVVLAAPVHATPFAAPRRLHATSTTLANLVRTIPPTLMAEQDSTLLDDALSLIDDLREFRPAEPFVFTASVRALMADTIEDAFTYVLAARIEATRDKRRKQSAKARTSARGQNSAASRAKHAEYIAKLRREAPSKDDPLQVITDMMKKKPV